MTAERLSRRRLLAATATGVASAVAGCGYRPGGGEFDWRVAFGNRLPFGNSTDETWRTDGTSLFRIRNRSGRMFRGEDSGFEDVDTASVTTYRSTGETAWSGSAERPYVGDPAVDDGRVYLSLADGGVTALEAPDDEATEDDRDPTDRDEDEPDPRWTIDWAGPPLSLHAGSGIIVGVHEDGLVGLDADDGAERFALERASLAADAVVDVALAPDRLWVLSDAAAGAGSETETSEATLYGLAADGTVETTRSLPVDAFWVESVGSDAVVGTADEIRAIAPDGDRRFAVPTAESGRTGTPLAVTDADRCYYYSRGTLEAIDVAAGEVVWRHDDDSFRGSPVADGDGVYGWKSGSERGRCDLVAVTSAGERWWTAPPLEDLHCATDLFLVDDRLVVVSEEALYGFRKAPGERLSVL